MTGAQLGSYRVLDKLGEGGMGEVYRATDANLGRQVAIKVLPAHVAHDAERLARFEREARTLATLNHPNIATLYGLERSGDASALVMELVEGPTLAERIAMGPIPVEEALPIARQIAEALEAAHAQGIVHRDLKPANIKVRPDGTVKVLDFGLAKALDPAAGGAGSPGASLSPTITSPAQTLQGVILGTAAYMSPEQARGKAVDARADNWAFGCVLYEMLTGRRAFGPSAIARSRASTTPAVEDDDVSLTLARVLERDVDLSALPAGVPPRVRKAIAVCLRKDLRQRVQAIGDVRLALEGAFEDERPPVAGVQTSRAAWWRTGVALLAGALVTAAAVAPLAWRPDALPEVSEFLIQAPPGGRLPLGTPAITNDGEKFAYTVADTNGVARIHVRRRDSTSSTVVPGTEGAMHPFWSPDGESIAFATLSDGQLKRIEIEGGTPRPLGGTNAPWHGSWAGRSILTIPLGRIPDEGGQREPVGQPDLERGERALNYPEFLSDGRRFLLRVAGDQHMSIQLGTLGSMARTLVLDNVDSAPLVARTPRGKAYLLYLRPPDLIAHEFDEETATVRGDPRILVRNVGLVANPPVRPTVGVSSAGHLAYQTGGIGTAGQLAWLDGRGREVETVRYEASVVRPRISPVNPTLVVGHRFDDTTASVWVSDLARQTTRPLTSNAGTTRDAVWSPDGTRIAFRRMSEAPGIYVIGEDGAGERRLTDEQFAPLSWSPQGYLLYQNMAGLSVRAVDREEAPIDVGARSGRSLQGAFSPDGRYIAYTSDETRRAEVWVQPAPPARGRHVQVSLDGGSDPQWSINGRELYFVSASGDLMAAEIDTRNGLNAGTPRPLFPTSGRNMRSGYAPAANGRFLVPRLDLQDSPITVVLNWWVRFEGR